MASDSIIGGLVCGGLQDLRCGFLVSSLGFCLGKACVFMYQEIDIGLELTKF
jgi:hypothetical protein